VLLLLLAMGTVRASESQQINDHAIKLLRSANLSTDVWWAAAVMTNTNGNNKYWIVSAYNKPTFYKESVCVARGKIRQLEENTKTSSVNVLAEQNDDLVYVNRVLTSHDCETVKEDAFFSVDPSLSISRVLYLINEIRKTSKCHNTDALLCGGWKAVQIPTGDIAGYFSHLSSLRVLSVTKTDNNDIEIRYRPSGMVPVFLVCTIHLNSDGSRILDVGAGPIER
jgi:hypothetical protein